jgi:hypothetical protein
MQQANALNDVALAAYWALVGGQASIYSVVWILLPIVGSEEDVGHVCFLSWVCCGCS